MTQPHTYPLDGSATSSGSTGSITTLNMSEEEKAAAKEREDNRGAFGFAQALTPPVPPAQCEATVRPSPQDPGPYRCKLSAGHRAPSDNPRTAHLADTPHGEYVFYT